jgi:CBS domain-containing protein
MKALDVGVLPVCEGEGLVGLITDRDITIEETAEPRDPDSTRVRDCMRQEIAYCFEDQDAKDAEGIMQEKPIRPSACAHARETAQRNCRAWRSPDRGCFIRSHHTNV